MNIGNPPLAPFNIFGKYNGNNDGLGNSINTSGQIAGSINGTDGGNHAFLYSNGTMTDLGNLGGGYADALSINDSAQITGFASTSSGYNHAFLYSAGTGMT